MIREKINTQRGHWLFEGRGLITKCFFFPLCLSVFPRCFIMKWKFVSFLKGKMFFKKKKHMFNPNKCYRG